MGVSVDTIAKPFTTPMALARSYAVRYAGSGGTQLPASDTDSWKKVTAAWKAGRKVYRDINDGHFLIGDVAVATARPLNKPRIGLYRSFIPSIDEGWTRWVFDQFGFEYTRLTNDAIRAGGLRRQYDVIIFASQSPSSIRNGYRESSMPKEYTGGLGDEGAQALRDFASRGGRLVFLNDASDYAVSALQLDLQNITRGVPNSKLYVPGSLLNVTLASGSPLTVGLPQHITIWNEGSPAWDEPTGNGGSAASVANYPQDDLLASGWLLGEEILAGKSALLDLKVGQGHVILFGMRPQYRAQSYLTYKLLFNALVY